MAALNFKPQFADLVSSGQKMQTIRQVRKHPIKVGDTLWLYTGMRTKQCRPLGDAVVTDVSPILISHDGLIRLAGHYLSSKSILGFIEKDGFSDFLSFFEFFERQYGTDDFHGVLIKWRLVTAGML